jgi:hypothetical protein
MPDEELWQQLFATKRDPEAQIERGHAERDRLAERVKVLEAALRWYADEIPAEYEIHDSGGYICPASWLAERARAALGAPVEET